MSSTLFRSCRTGQRDYGEAAGDAVMCVERRVPSVHVAGPRRPPQPFDVRCAFASVAAAAEHVELVHAMRASHFGTGGRPGHPEPPRRHQLRPHRRPQRAAIGRRTRTRARRPPAAASARLLGAGDAASAAHQHIRRYSCR